MKLVVFGLRVRFHNLCSNNIVGDYAFQAHILAKLFKCGKILLQFLKKQRTHRSSFRKLVKPMAKVCTERKNRTRQLWLPVR